MTRKRKASSADVFEGTVVPAESETGLRPSDDSGTVLLNRCRTYWQMAEWEKLGELAGEDLERYRERGRLAVLAAAGLAQLGEMERAREYALRAQEWGCNRAVLAQVLVGGAYNSLGRAASLLEDEDLAGQLFEQSVACVLPQDDAAVLGRSRNIQEKMRLGQLPDAMRSIGRELRHDPAPDHVRILDGQLARLERRIEELTPRPRTLPTILKNTARGTDRMPEAPLLVCGHHKVGTNFLLPVFREISETFSLPIWLKFYDPEPPRWQICLHQHSRLEGMTMPANFRGVHMVRHPMGLLHSATLYHERGKEPWLNVPMQRFTGETFWAVSSRDSYNVIKDPERSVHLKIDQLTVPPPPHARVHDFDSGYDFAGRTYAEMLRSFDTLEEKILFEMRCYSRAVLLDMLAFPADRRFMTVKLEDVTHDRAMQTLQPLVRHLGFGGEPAAQVLKIAAKNSQWNKGKTAHATTGVSLGWKDLFRGELGDAFHELFGWAEEALGYD